ncbi:hypothetical protein J4H92_01060 [Leucobacter weissii]|uniref:Uncharacterized protein n=1 Tax=Leucobacter weissii TaxID=1983706 RepID=A0A939S4R0_9MICO|nr:hypothetical protein [Leucobacter weissii]
MQAKNDGAADFYRRYGFKPRPGDLLVLLPAELKSRPIRDRTALSDLR